MKPHDLTEQETKTIANDETEVRAIEVTRAEARAMIDDLGVEYEPLIEALDYAQGAVSEGGDSYLVLKITG